MALFRKQFATQSGRSGSASAASNAGVRAELWGQHGSEISWAAQKAFMKSDKASLLSVSAAAMILPAGSEPAGRIGVESAGVPPGAGIRVKEDVRTEGESAGAPPLSAGEDLPPEVIGVPSGAFTWS